jgi:hypothetical protein
MHYKMVLAAFLLLAGSLLSAPYLPANAGTFTDDFNTIDTGMWKVLTSGNEFTVNAVNNQLQLSLPGTATGYAMVEGRFALRGDFDMQVDFFLLDWPSNNKVEGGIELSSFGGDLIAGVGRNDLTQDSYGCEMINDNIFPFVPTGDMSGRLRIARTGTTITCYYWVSETWVIIGSLTDPLLAQDGIFSLNANLHSESTPGGQPVKVAYDNFQLQYDQLVPIPAREVNFEIKPGDAVKVINPQAIGAIPVAIFGSADFNVTKINVSSLSLNGLTVKQGKAGKYLASKEYVNGDRYPDLIVQFDNNGQWLDTGNSAILTGNLVNGTQIGGTQNISLVP